MLRKVRLQFLLDRIYRIFQIFLFGFPDESQKTKKIQLILLILSKRKSIM